MLIKTGIPKLDELLKGGVERNSKTLIFSTPEVKSSQFTQQIAFNHLKDGFKVTYISINKKPSMIKNMFHDYDWNISKFEKLKIFSIIDVYDKIIKKEDLEEIKKDILESLNKIPNDSIIIVDSLSSLLDIFELKKEILDLVNLITNLKQTVVAIFTNWPYQKSITTTIRSKFSCIIDLKTLEKNIIIGNYFTVSKAKWIKNLKKQSVLFNIINPGGIREFIPKLLITGTFEAGKSTFTHAISTKATSVDRLGTTVALDYGHVSYKGYSADVFGTPGQTRFDPLLKMLGSKAVGIFLVIDPSKPETFARAKQMISLTEASSLPIVIVSNKRANKKSLSINQVKERLDTPKDVPVIECDALKKKNIDKALDALFKRIGD